MCYKQSIVIPLLLYQSSVRCNEYIKPLKPLQNVGNNKKTLCQFLLLKDVAVQQLILAGVSSTAVVSLGSQERVWAGAIIATHDKGLSIFISTSFCLGAGSPHFLLCWGDTMTLDMNMLCWDNYYCTLDMLWCGFCVKIHMSEDLDKLSPMVSM